MTVQGDHIYVCLCYVNLHVELGWINLRICFNSPGSIACIENNCSICVFKLFINAMERGYTIEAPHERNSISKCKQYTSHDLRGPKHISAQWCRWHFTGRWRIFNPTIWNNFTFNFKLFIQKEQNIYFSTKHKTYVVWSNLTWPNFLIYNK